MIIFSDLHGNAEALESLVDESDDLLCLGDVIGGKDDENCVRLIEQHDVTIISGNHEEMSKKKLPVKLQKRVDGWPVEIHGEIWSAYHSSPRSIWKYLRSKNDFCKAMRRSVRKIMFAGHTHKPTLYKGSAPFRLVRKPIEFGKTYPIQENKYYYLNPGSASQPRGDWDEPSYIEFNEDGVTWRKLEGHGKRRKFGHSSLKSHLR